MCCSFPGPDGLDLDCPMRNNSPSTTAADETTLATTGSTVKWVGFPIGRSSELDGLRGLAIALVLWHHLAESARTFSPRFNCRLQSRRAYRGRDLGRRDRLMEVFEGPLVAWGQRQSYHHA